MPEEFDFAIRPVEVPNPHKHRRRPPAGIERLLEQRIGATIDVVGMEERRCIPTDDVRTVVSKKCVHSVGDVQDDTVGVEDEQHIGDVGHGHSVPLPIGGAFRRHQFLLSSRGASCSTR